MRKHILLALIMASLLLAACAARRAGNPHRRRAGGDRSDSHRSSPDRRGVRDRRGWRGVADDAALAVDRLLQHGEQFTVETPASYGDLNADGTVNIVADCNNAAGTYTAARSPSPSAP